MSHDTREWPVQLIETLDEIRGELKRIADAMEAKCPINDAVSAPPIDRCPTCRTLMLTGNTCLYCLYHAK